MPPGDEPVDDQMEMALAHLAGGHLADDGNHILADPPLDVVPSREMVASVTLHVELEEPAKVIWWTSGASGGTIRSFFGSRPSCGVKILSRLLAGLSDGDAREGSDGPAVLLVLAFDPIDDGEGAMPLVALAEAKPRDHSVTPFLPVLAIGNAETAQGRSSNLML